MFVLIVEDDAELREFYHSALTPAGHSVLMPEDGDTALDLIERMKPDAIITDLVLPNGSGALIVAEAQRRGIPLLVISGYTDAYRSLLPEGTMTLQKGEFPLGDLVSIVEATLARN